MYKLIVASQNGAPGGIITMQNNAPLLTKLTNIETYWFLNSKDASMAERINFCDSLQKASKTIFMNYYSKSKLLNGHHSYEREFIGFVDIMLKITEIEYGIVDGILNAQASLTQKQTDGLKQFVHGATTMESGALFTLEKEYMYYSEASMCKLSRSFKEFYTAFYNRLDADVKAEFDRRIANMIKTHPILCVRTGLQGEKK